LKQDQTQNKDNTDKIRPETKTTQRKINVEGKNKNIRNKRISVLKKKKTKSLFCILGEMQQELDVLTILVVA
jgi:hypothetical protein